MSESNRETLREPTCSGKEDEEEEGERGEGGEQKQLISHVWYFTNNTHKNFISENTILLSACIGLFHLLIVHPHRRTLIVSWGLSLNLVESEGLRVKFIDVKEVF